MLKKMQRRFILAAMAAFGTVMLLLLAGINIANFQRTTAAQDEMVRNLLRWEERVYGQPEAGLQSEDGLQLEDGLQPEDGLQLEDGPQLEDGLQPEDSLQLEDGLQLADGLQPEAGLYPGDAGRPESADYPEAARHLEAAGHSGSAGHPETVSQPRPASRPDTALPPLGEQPFGGPEAAFTTRFFAVHYDPSGQIRFISRDHISSIDEETAETYGAAVLEKGRKKGYYGEYRYGVSRRGESIIILFLNAAAPLQYARSLFWLSLAIGTASLAVVFGLVVFFSRYAIRPYMKNIQRQKRFITDAGHELKTPITSIAASADIAAMEYEGDEWISNIQKQTARLSKLVGELVALSRLDEETPLPEKSTFSLSDAAWEAAEPFAVLAKASGKVYEQNIEDKLTLYGDNDAIRQMISILLDNALKYSGENGAIRLDIYRRRGKIYIRVFNTCCLPGIPDLDRLFDRFYRPDESRSSHTGGTGIGLSMAQAIAEAHGGRIRAESEDGRSIWFTVVLFDR